MHNIVAANFRLMLRLVYIWLKYYICAFSECRGRRECVSKVDPRGAGASDRSVSATRIFIRDCHLVSLHTYVISPNRQ